MRIQRAMAPSFDVVSLGEPLYEFSELPDASRRWQQGFGGDTSNCAIAAARQGARVGYVTRLGQDEFGEQFLALWHAEGLDVSGVGSRSGRAHGGLLHHAWAGGALVQLSARGLGRQPHAARAPAARPDWRQPVLPHVRHHAGHQHERLRHRLRRDPRRETGWRPRSSTTPTSDCVCGPPRGRGPSSRPPSPCRMSSCSVSMTQRCCADTASPRSFSTGVTRRVPRGVVITLGQQGVIGSDGTRREHIAGHSVETVDATGAGDCFAGALMARMSAGDDYWTALRYANAAAALTTTGYGAVSPIPRPVDVRRLLGAAADPFRL